VLDDLAGRGEGLAIVGEPTYTLVLLAPWRHPEELIRAAVRDDRGRRWCAHTNDHECQAEGDEPSTSSNQDGPGIGCRRDQVKPFGVP
jgi:hypothetical protein